MSRRVCMQHSWLCVSRVAGTLLSSSTAGLLLGSLINRNSSSSSTTALQDQLDWQTEMDTSLYNLVAQAKDKLYFAAGQVAIDQPFTLFFRELQEAQKSQVPGSMQPTAADTARSSSYVTFPLKLGYTSSSSGSSSNSADTLFQAAKPLLQLLVDAAVPSSFGRGRDSVFDPAYRTALELPASHMALSIPHPPPEVLQQIKALLQPSAEAVVADLYKLNIYGPGGFFKPHFDTPRSEDMFGSLVVCLPSPHSGGGLVLRHKNSPEVSHCFDWSSKKPAETFAASSSSGSSSTGSIQQELGSLQWAAFYSDSEHEVLPVTDGYRITLTYNLRAVGGSSNIGSSPSAAVPPALSDAVKHAFQEHVAVIRPEGVPVRGYSCLTAADVASSAGLVGHIKQLLADDRWHPEGDTLGFVLTHRYARDLASLAGLPFPAALKGPDRLLWAALAQAGLQPRVLPMLKGWTGITEHKMDWFETDILPSRSQARLMGYKGHADGADSPKQSAAEAEAVQAAAQRAKHKAAMLQQLQESWPDGTFDPDWLRETYPGHKFEDEAWGLMLSSWGSVRGSPWGGCNWVEEHVYDEDHADSVSAVYDGNWIDNVCWIAPIKNDDFMYEDSFLAGGNEPLQVAFYASAVLLVDVPSWSCRKLSASSVSSSEQ